jgi:hypothetical protein
MRNLDSGRFSGSAGLGGIADNDYDHAEFADEHDKNYNRKDQHQLNTEIAWRSLKSIVSSARPRNSNS